MTDLPPVRKLRHHLRFAWRSSSRLTPRTSQAEPSGWFPGWPPEETGEPEPEPDDPSPQCYELVPANDSPTRPTPAIQLHSPHCRCSPEDPVLAIRIAEHIQSTKQSASASSPTASSSKTTIQQAQSPPPAEPETIANTPNNVERSWTVRCMLSAARLFLPTMKRWPGSPFNFSPAANPNSPRTPSSPASSPATNPRLQDNLCTFCAEFNIDDVARYNMHRWHSDGDWPAEAVDINAASSAGLTPLMATVCSARAATMPRSQAVMVRYLVEGCGADVRVRAGEARERVLDAACRLGLVGVVRVLVRCGAVATREEGWAALSAALRADNAECVRVLVEEATVDLDGLFAVVGEQRPKGEDDQGDFAVFPYTCIVSWLRAAAARRRFPWLRASRWRMDEYQGKRGVFGVGREWLRCWRWYGEAEMPTRCRVAALHLAYASRACTSALLDGGALVDVRDARERTPLHWAAGSGSFHVATLLVSAGADVSAVSAGDITPLDAAMEALENDKATRGHSKVLQLLMKQGAHFGGEVRAKRGGLKNRLLDLVGWNRLLYLMLLELWEPE